MPVPLHEIGRRGRMDLRFGAQNGHTILQRAYCEVPFKITRVLPPLRPFAHLILMQCSAGLFGGDQLDCSIHVERGAKVLLTQQSATKVHPSQNRPAIQRHHVVVENGAELQLYFEPVIPFAGSSLQQSIRIDVEEGARLVFWEGLMAGRIGRGERWCFRELGSETDLRVNGKTVYLERFALPSGCERSDYVMGEYNYLGTGLYVGEHASAVAAALREALTDAGIDTLTPLVAITRLVSASGPDFHRCRDAFRRQLEPNRSSLSR
jgi:urease accessory protein